MTTNTKKRGMYSVAGLERASVRDALADLIDAVRRFELANGNSERAGLIQVVRQAFNAGERIFPMVSFHIAERRESSPTGWGSDMILGCCNPYNPAGYTADNNPSDDDD